MTDPSSDDDKNLPEFLKRKDPGPDVTQVLADARRDAIANPRKPFSKPPKGARAGAAVVLAVLLVIWGGLKIFNWLTLPPP